MFEVLQHHLWLLDVFPDEVVPAFPESVGAVRLNLEYLDLQQGHPYTNIYTLTSKINVVTRGHVFTITVYESNNNN